MFSFGFWGYGPIALRRRPFLLLKLDFMKRDIIAFDTETTGVEITTAYIIQIALKRLQWQGDGTLQVVSSWQTYIKPPIPIPEKITELTGITEADVENAPPFAEIAPTILRGMRGCDLMAYNAMQLDLPLLAQEFDRAGLEFLKLHEFNLIDPYQIFCRHEPRTLSGAMKFYCEREIENAHDAQGDVVAMIDVFNAQRTRYALTADVAALNELSKPQNAKDFADFSRCLYWLDGVLYFAFGKNKDKPVDEERRYADWMLNNEFTASTKNVLSEWLSRKTPTLFK